MKLRMETVTWMVREIFVVTVGILLAFMLNAWWLAHVEARQEQLHLKALAADFHENRERLAHFIEAQDRISASCRELLALARGGQPASNRSVRELMSQVFSSDRFEPVMGAYEGLVNSAGLTLISDEALRGTLANFAARIRGEYLERFSEQHYFGFVREFTGRLHFVEDPEALDARPDAYADLLGDPRFQEFLLIRESSERELAGEYRELLELVEAILARIEKEKVESE